MKITREVKAGFVVITTLIAFYALFNFLKGQNLFFAGDTYYVIYEDVSGLVPSKSVTVNGIRVGSVDDVEIMEGKTPLQVLVTLKLNKTLNLSKNSIAEIWEPALMGGTEVRLLPDYSGDKLKSGDTLRGLVKASTIDMMTEKLEPTQKKLDSTLVSLQTTLGNVDKVLDDENRDNLRKALKSLDATLVSFNSTSQSLTRTSDNAGKFLDNNEVQIKKTLTSADEALVSAKQTMVKFDQVADKLNNLELEKIIRNFETVSEKLNTTLDGINNGEGTLGAMMNDRELYDNLTKTSKALDEVLNDLKENPGKYIQFSIFGKKEAVAKD